MYKLVFTESAARQYNRLDGSIRPLVMKAIQNRLKNPYITSARLRGDRAGQYRIKLAKAGIRIIYEVQEELVTVAIIRIGKRENDEVYLLPD